MAHTEAHPVDAASTLRTPPFTAHTRLQVQAAAARTKRRHFVRAVQRIAVLGLADSVVIAGARELLHLLREAPFSADLVATAFPEGFMGGWGTAAAILVGLVFSGAYGSKERWASPRTVVRGVGLGAAMAMWQSIDTLGIVWTVMRWVIVFSVLGIALAVERLALSAIVFRFPLAGPDDRAILVGDPESPAAKEALRVLERRRGIQCIGWLSERASVEDYLGHPSAVWEVLCETGTDTVVVCGQLPPELFETLVEAAAVAGCRCLAVRANGTLMASQPRALNGPDLRMLELTFPAARAGQDVVKRLFDLGAGSLLVLLASPVLLGIALWVKLDSHGPVFFVQDRVGQAGRIFRMLKFRTMSDGADDQKAELAHLNQTGDPRLFKIPNDPRVTRAGVLLRRWSLDELPQLLNVVKGEMSLVGPRPFFEADLAAYDDHHFIRLSVKPGVTGLWQVRGRSSILDFEEVVELDRRYVENWSFWMDLRILLETLPAVVRRTGAY